MRQNRPFRPKSDRWYCVSALSCPREQKGQEAGYMSESAEVQPISAALQGRLYCIQQLTYTHECMHALLVSAVRVCRV